MIAAQRNWKIGGATTIIGASWFYLLLWHIMPEARGGGLTNASKFMGFYSQFGNTPAQIVKAIILNPNNWINYFVTHHRIYYFLRLLTPVAFLALFSPIILLATPEFMLNTLSSVTTMTSLAFQYTSIISAFLFISMTFGLRNLLKWSKLLAERHQAIITLKQVEATVLALVIICFGFSIWRWSLFPLMHHANNQVADSKMPAFASYINSLASTLASSASVSTTLSLEPHFSERQNIYSYPTGVGLADYLIIRTDDPYQDFSNSYLQQALSKCCNGARYHLIHQSDSILVYEKSH